MKRRFFIAMTCCTLCLLALPLSALAASQDANPIRRFDFGPPQSPVAEGFIGVSAADVYDAERGFGFDAGRPTDHDMNTAGRAVVTLDDLSRDRVMNPKRFRVDLPNGRYSVAVFTGSYTSVYVDINQHRSMMDEQWIRHGEKQLHHRPAWTAETYFAPDGPYFASYDVFYRPGQSLWRDYMVRHFPVIRFEVEVTDNTLALDFSDHFSLGALMLWPADEASAGQAVLAQVEQARQAFFDGHYQRVPGERHVPSVTATTAEQQAGLVLFSRHAMMPIYPETFPYREEIDQPLRALVAQGSEVAMQLGCVPLRDFKTLTLSVSDLQGPATLPADILEIRYARYSHFIHQDQQHYTISPRLLTLQSQVPGDAKVARGFFLSVRVPQDAQPGIYTATVHVHTDDGSQASLPLQLRVLPFALPKPEIAVGAYYNLPNMLRFRSFMFLTDRDPAAMDEMILREIRSALAMMRRLGHTHVSPDPSAPLTVTADGVVAPRPGSYELFLALGDAIRDAGFDSFTVFGMGWSRLLNTVPGFLNRTATESMDLDAIRFPDSAKAPAAALISGVYDIVSDRHWPEMLFYLSDELGNMGTRGLPYGQALRQFINDIRPMIPHEFRTLASTLRFSVIRPMLGEVDIIVPNSAFPLNDETLGTVQSAGSQVWLYNTGSNRLSFGYYPWKIGAQGRLQWAYEYSGSSPDPYFGLARHPADYDSSVSPTLEAIPSQWWFVAAAEGIRDHQYLQLLQNRLADHPDHPAAASARQVLAELDQRISITYLDEINNWQPGTYDYFRWQIAKAIMAFDAPTAP